MNIIEEIYNVNNYEVLSDISFIDISHVIKTIKMKKYIVYFSSGDIIECADRHKFINYDYNEIFCSDLIIGDLILSNDGLDEVFDIVKTDEFINMYDLSLPEHHLYYTNNILSHNSQLMANMAARQVLHGHNIVLLTLEMSENEFAQRFDSIYSKLDINRIYLLEKYKNKLVKTLKELRDQQGRGELFIKQFPTGAASVRDFKIYLRELIIRGIKISCIYVDYINLMKSAYKQYGDMYSSVKTIAEELRALSFEFEVPVISVSQLNREGSFVGFEQIDFNYIAESHGVPATADFMGIMGEDEDEMVYQNEIWYKIVKNRLGGRVGETNKFYNDARSLKIYDATELDLWMSEKEFSGDERKIFQRVQREQANNSRRGR